MVSTKLINVNSKKEMKKRLIIRKLSHFYCYLQNQAQGTNYRLYNYCSDTKCDFKARDLLQKSPGKFTLINLLTDLRYIKYGTCNAF